MFEGAITVRRQLFTRLVPFVVTLLIFVISLIDPELAPMYESQFGLAAIGLIIGLFLAMSWLWRTWEDLRRDGQTGMSSWWRDHADHHMQILLSMDGPFKGCTPEKGHNPRLAPLPCTPPPENLFVPQ